MERVEEVPSRSAASALGYAIGGGALGFVVTTVVGYLTREPFTFYARGLVTAALLGAGVGWLVGAAIGVLRTRDAAAPTPLGSWTLRVIGIGFVLAALTAPWWTGFVPRTLGLGFHVTAREPMERTIWLDAMLAALTCFVLATRTYRRRAIAVGAILGVAIVAVAIVSVANGPCPLTECDEALGLR